ncbi:uncharacterized protein [Lolium perenne]|uniref:uncharacterized protein isoform X1 n=1 Tax=Lolium perenne TaxID=4522 RepID=UPI0021F5631E|nr:uncharacterized protein LOC127336839 isoform X1 [Lolium perenne]
MASLFGARRRRSPEDNGEDSDGSGSEPGRAKRRRLEPEGASPGGWLSTFVSGARRVLSTVLFSSSEEQVSEDEEEEEEDSSEPSQDGNEDIHNGNGAAARYSESKLAIEKMVMKESFSRDECDKMVKLLQSRVTDSTFPETYENGTPNEIPRRKSGAGHDFTGAWRSLNHNRDFPESGSFSSIEPGYFSPGSPLQASPELCNAAVMEAKKWLEEKRQGLGTIAENHGPCTLNTEMFKSVSPNPVEDDKGSPVDVAKSYMQSLPPWQSPLLGIRKFKTPPSGGVHINVYERKSKLSSPAKFNTEEDFFSSANFRENLEELRRDRMKSSETILESSKSRLRGSTSSLFDNDLSLFSPGTREEIRPVQSCKGSDKAAAAEPANECSLPVAPTKDGNDGTVDSVDPAWKDSNLVQESHPASKVHPDDVPQGNHMPLTSAAKDVAERSGDINSVPAEPEIHEESLMNSTSESRPKDAAPQTEISLRALKKKVQTSLSGSTNRTSANGLLDRSDGNSGVDSSRNDNPGCTNSSSAVLPDINELINSTTDADGNCVDKNGTIKDSEKPVDGNSVENGAENHSEEPVKVAPKPLRRGRKRAARRN